jgi:hypothetical protein
LFNTLSRVRAGVIARLHIPGAALQVEVGPAPQSRGRNLADYNRPLYGGNSHAFRQDNHTFHEKAIICQAGIGRATWRSIDAAHHSWLTSDRVATLLSVR